MTNVDGITIIPVQIVCVVICVDQMLIEVTDIGSGGHGTSSPEFSNRLHWIFVNIGAILWWAGHAAPLDGFDCLPRNCLISLSNVSLR
ncbi:MAG: hypothetical protein AAFY39_04825, partial [Pseudomonadota bacterium]